MKPCNRSGCEVYPFDRKGNGLKNPLNNKAIQINANVDCNSKNYVYCIFCNKQGYKQIYVGQSQRELKTRFSEHKTSVQTRTNKVVGQHLNGPGHSLNNLEVAAIEKVFEKGKISLKREKVCGLII